MSKLTNSITRLSTTASNFEQQLNQLLRREMLVEKEVTEVVGNILADVKLRGDQAVVDFTNQFDGYKVQSIKELIVSSGQLQNSLASLSNEQRQSLTHAAERIKSYHEKQKQSSWQYKEADGSVYGQKISPLERVGIYVPGGKANYPSSVLMLAIPAQVAGVNEIIATVPTPYGDDGKLIFAAAALAGVSQLYTVGGAQAIAALAYGTETIPRVDKIDL